MGAARPWAAASPHPVRGGRDVVQRGRTLPERFCRISYSEAAPLWCPPRPCGTGYTARPRRFGACRNRAAFDADAGGGAGLVAPDASERPGGPSHGGLLPMRDRVPETRVRGCAPPHDRPPVGRCPAGGRQGASTSLPFRPWAPAAVSWHFCALTAGGTRVLSLSCEARHAAAAQTLHWWTAGAVHVAGRRAARARGGASAGGRGARAAAQPVRLRPFRGAAGSLRAHAFGGSVVGCLLLRGGCLFPTGVGSLLLRRLHGHPQAPAARHRHRGVH